jgi:diaminopimelate epimerase
MVNTSLHFTKMHGLGNDFIVINALTQALNLKNFSFPTLANRHTGIGFDQLLVIEASQKADFFCRIYNADGSEAEQCGNGLRCVARYLHEENIITKNNFTIETSAGVFPLEIKDYDHIRVGMGLPQIKHALIKLNIENTPKAHNLTNSLAISVLSLGNPHAIARLESTAESIAVEDNSFDKLAAEISANALFPNGANVGFMQIINKNHIRLRTFERGVGETFACGSNACAAAVAGIANAWLAPQVTVDFRYGSLVIDWQGENQPIYMTGPAARVFSGVLAISAR